MKAVKYNKEQKAFVDNFRKSLSSHDKGIWGYDYEFETLHASAKTDELKSKASIIREIKSSIKEHYLVQQDFKCAYCKQKNLTLNKKIWETEHIVDKHSHGIFTFEPLNLCISCPDCNGADGKGTKQVLVKPSKAKKPRYPKSSASFKIIHPHFDEYDEHIEIQNQDGNVLVFKPLSKKGRETVEICGLLRFCYKYSNYSTENISDTDEVSEIVNKLKNNPELFTEVLRRYSQA